MPQSLQLQVEAVARIAGRILTAWHDGQTVGLQRELEHVRWLVAQPNGWSLATERLDALSAVAESLKQESGPTAGALRILEHLALYASPGQATR